VQTNDPHLIQNRHHGHPFPLARLHRCQSGFSLKRKKQGWRELITISSWNCRKRWRR